MVPAHSPPLPSRCVTRPLPLLLHHNVFLSSDGEAAWSPRASRPEALRRCPNFYVHVPSRTDPSAAPPGCESVMVLLPVANLQEMARAASFRPPTSELDELQSERASDAGSLLGAQGGVGGSCIGRVDGGREGFYHELVSAGKQAVLRTLCKAGVFDGDEKELQDCISKEIVIDPEEWEARWDTSDA